MCIRDRTYIGSLGLVENVSTAEFDGQRLELNLRLLGDAQQLHEVIALDRDLLPITNIQRASESVQHYRWTR